MTQLPSTKPEVPSGTWLSIEWKLSDIIFSLFYRSKYHQARNWWDESRPSHMRRLYEICQSPTKIWKPLPGGDHNSSVVEEGYFEAIEDFIANLDTKTGWHPPNTMGACGIDYLLALVVLCCIFARRLAFSVQLWLYYPGPLVYGWVATIYDSCCIPLRLEVRGCGGVFLDYAVIGVGYVETLDEWDLALCVPDLLLRNTFLASVLLGE